MNKTADAALARVLLIEDDAMLAPLVVRHLVDSGFAVDWVSEGTAARQRLAKADVDLVILDIMLPGEDGLSLCRRIRKDANVAIIMVTARGQESDRIMGLELGADDYLPKPFSLWELEARMKAVLRRCSRNTPQASSIRVIGPLLIDPEQRTLAIGEQRIDLTRSEFDMLLRLTSEPGRVFSREHLLASVQGGDTDAFDRAVDTHISNLRRKIEPDPKAPRYLKTVWGIGYRFDLP
jgi:two-component system phosphate regulon response regulator OmpR